MVGPPLILAGESLPLDQIAEWAKWGGGWALVPVLSVVIYLLDKRAHHTASRHADAIDKCQVDRINDWKDISRTLEGHTMALNSVTTALNQATDASERRTEATNRMAEAAKIQAAALERLIQVADGAATSNRELRERIITRLPYRKPED